MSVRRSTILLEVSAPEEAAAFGARLLRAGFEVSCCSGPASGTACPLLAGARCRLVEQASVVVHSLEGVDAASVRMKLGRRHAIALLLDPRSPASVLRHVQRLSAAHARTRRAVRVVRGRGVVIRAIEARDAEAYRAFDAGLSEQSRRLRYLGYMPPLDLERARQLATVDFDRRFALVAVTTDGCRIVADCRLVPTPDGSAEMAIAVADDFQGGGLGGFMLELILGIAADRGITAVTAEVRYDNERMLRLLRCLGFRRTAWELGIVSFSYNWRSGAARSAGRSGSSRGSG